jgi:hypothetical protein
MKMKLTTNQYKIIFATFILLILFVSFYKFSLFSIERFTSNQYSHTVNLPLTTRESCKNLCGPNARCAITGHQCMADIDCPGCQPNPQMQNKNEPSVPGNNDAGKLTLGVTPQYSQLTSGFGTHETRITNNMFSKPQMADFGVNIWNAEFVEEEKLFNERYQPTNIPNYPQRFSLTGQFIEDGPFASNAAI